MLEKIDAVAGHLPQLIQLGTTAGQLDYQATVRQMLGIDDKPLYAETDLTAMQQRLPEIRTRIEQRSREIEQIVTATEQVQAPKGGVV